MLSDATNTGFSETTATELEAATSSAKEMKKSASPEKQKEENNVSVDKVAAVGEEETTFVVGEEVKESMEKEKEKEEKTPLVDGDNVYQVFLNEAAEYVLLNQLEKAIESYSQALEIMQVLFNNFILAHLIDFSIGRKSLVLWVWNVQMPIIDMEEPCTFRVWQIMQF